MHGFQLMFSAGPICKAEQHGHTYPLHKSISEGRNQKGLLTAGCSDEFPDKHGWNN
jgi:hypothetical protein